MSLKNLNVPKKTRKFLLDKLKDKKIFQIYKKFESDLLINNNFIVAVSGGPDSLALSFLAKIFAIKNFLNVKYFIVDHKLRKKSTLEAKYVQKLLKNYLIDLDILTWKGTKPNSNIQSIARDKRYELLINKAKKYKRVKVRNFLKQLGLEGLDRDKFFLTIKNLKIANENIKFYIKKNLDENVTFIQKKEKAILKDSFFSQSEEVVFRSFAEVIKIVGKKYYPVRGKKIDKIIQSINLQSSLKVTLGGCIIKKVNGTIILLKE